MDGRPGSTPRKRTEIFLGQPLFHIPRVQMDFVQSPERVLRVRWRPGTGTWDGRRREVPKKGLKEFEEE